MAKSINFRSSKRKGFITKKDISDEIIKKQLELKGLQRISKLQKKFKLSQVMRGTRTSIKKRIQQSPNITVEAKQKVKIFEIKGVGRVGRRGVKGSILIPGVPKGIKIKTKKRTRFFK